MIDNTKEYILCAAVWFDDGNKHSHQPKNIETGIVVCGRRHHNCFATIGGRVSERNEIGLREKEQGFLTSLDRFVSREEAAEIALSIGQFANEEEKREVEITHYLYSENIY